MLLCSCLLAADYTFVRNFFERKVASLFSWNKKKLISGSETLRRFDHP